MSVWRCLLLSAAAACLVWPHSPAARAGEVDLPATGQTSCWDSGGSVVPCEGTGDDGEIQAGVAWPTPRFLDLGDCMRDKLTGLTWATDADLLDQRPTWDEALAFANDLALCNASDWRIPNVVEMRSLYHAEIDTRMYLAAAGFTTVRNDYWTSTTNPASPSRAFFVAFAGGGVASLPKDNRALAYAWPVRGPTAAPAPTWETGQDACFDAAGAEIDCMDTGQDGDHRAGVSWPAPRFTDHGNGTATDELTGLVWSLDALAPGPSACVPGVWKSWTSAHAHIECLNDRAYLGFDDWGLPNLTQLSSLLDYASSNPILPADHPFQNVQQDAAYWSSTTAAYLGNYGWVVDLTDGIVGTGWKGGHGYHVWPVRVPEPGAWVSGVAAGIALFGVRRIRRA